MSSHHRNRRTELFLVRVWSRSGPDGSGRSVYGGRVQRVVDGESHQFDDWQGLSDLLLEMVSRSEKPRPEDTEAN